MTRSTTTIDFIHMCNQKGTKRFDTFKDKIGFEAKIFRKKIKSIMDFIQDMDEMCHKYDEKRISSKTFFGSIFHYHISSDLRSLIILSTTGASSTSRDNTHDYDFILNGYPIQVKTLNIKYDSVTALRNVKQKRKRKVDNYAITQDLVKD
jgi:hypothetical protein